MRKITRRNFLATSGSMLAASSVAGCTKDRAVQEGIKAPVGLKAFDSPLSFQSYGMRRQIEQDFPGTLQAVQKLGYQGVEMCSPRSYQRSGFGNLTDKPPEEIARMEARAKGFRLTADACEFISEYQWPGNVRELRNAVAAATVYSDTGKIARDELSRAVHGAGDPSLRGLERTGVRSADRVFQRFLEGVSSGGSFGARDFANATGVSLRSAQRHLAELRRAGRVERIGAGRAARYEIRIGQT